MAIDIIISTTVEPSTPRLAGKILKSHQEATWTTSTASTRAPARSYLACWRLRMSQTTTATSNWVNIKSSHPHLSQWRPTLINNNNHRTKRERNLFENLLEDQQTTASARAAAEGRNKAMGNFHFKKDCRRIERSSVVWFRANNCNAHTRTVFRVLLIYIKPHLTLWNIYLRQLRAHLSQSTWSQPLISSIHLYQMLTNRWNIIAAKA